MTQYGTAASKRAPAAATMFSFPAPTKGWLANGNIAIAQQGGAERLDNWFPTATGAIMRRGTELHATLGDASLPTSALFSYVNGNNRKLFGAIETTIYDITSVPLAYNVRLTDEDGNPIIDDLGNQFAQFSTQDLDVYTTTGGDWSVVQMATAGGTYLVGVNGVDRPFIYNGTNFYPVLTSNLYALDYDAETAAFTVGATLTGGTSTATGTIHAVTDNGTTGTLWLSGVTGTFQDNETITDSSAGSATSNGTATLLSASLSGSGIDTTDLSYVWTFKNRLFFVEKETMNAWYLPTDQIAGTLNKIALGGVFNLGGSLLFGASWSQDTGDGLNALCVFVSTEGEVAVYQGTDPGDANAWSLVGVYKIGKPLGPKAFIQAGGDLVIATNIGFVPLSQALQKDYAALSPSAVSAPIETAWNEAAELRSASNWSTAVWAAGQMVVVALPTINEQPAQWFVANARTGAWARFTGLDATCLLVFEDRLFFGSAAGRVVEANVSGFDEGAPYTATYLPMFNNLNAPGFKNVTMARSVMRCAHELREKITMQADYNISLPPAPDASPVEGESVWGTAVWGQSAWGSAVDKTTRQTWRGANCFAETVSPATMLTSGSVTPLDAEIIRTDLMYVKGGIIV